LKQDRTITIVHFEKISIRQFHATYHPMIQDVSGLIEACDMKADLSFTQKFGSRRDRYPANSTLGLRSGTGGIGSNCSDRQRTRRTNFRRAGPSNST
jgi:hypothetical protein